MPIRFYAGVDTSGTTDPQNAAAALQPSAVYTLANAWVHSIQLGELTYESGALYTLAAQFACDYVSAQSVSFTVADSPILPVQNINALSALSSGTPA